MQKAKGGHRGGLAGFGLAVVLPLFASCSDAPPQGPPPVPEAVHGDETLLPHFTDAASRVGLSFQQVTGGSGEYYLVETMGSGGGFLDFDDDGWLDVYLVQGGPLRGASDPTKVSNRLFHNRGDGTFEAVSPSRGAGETGYGMGACFGDYDNDGLTDIYVTNFGPDRLFLNEGEKGFRDVTEEAGIDNPSWGTSCSFADPDRDGCLDILVVNYLAFALQTHRTCEAHGHRDYCHPDTYSGAPNVYFHNSCDGTFEKSAAAAGLRVEDGERSKSLGLGWLDFDLDGWPDLYVANDSTRNYLFRNLSGGGFEETAVYAGAAFNGSGRTEASMGVAAGDFDGDGQEDLFLTHLDYETNTLYRNRGAAGFEDVTAASGLSNPSQMRVGWGANALDWDRDGDLDLFVANGHVLAEPERASREQPDQLFANLGDGTFRNVSESVGGDIGLPTSSRGSAVGDPDNDGDIDVLVMQNGGQARLLLNDGSDGRSWIGLDLRTGEAARRAIGARAVLRGSFGASTRTVRGGSSYLSQDDPRLHFGLGDEARIDELEIHWPSGRVQMIAAGDLEAESYNRIQEPGTLGETGS